MLLTLAVELVENPTEAVFPGRLGRQILLIMPSHIVRKLEMSKLCASSSLRVTFNFIAWLCILFLV